MPNVQEVYLQVFAKMSYKHNRNSQFFSKNFISNHSSYIAGFLSADGNVYKNYLQLEVSDYDIISHIKDSIEYEGKIGWRKRNINHKDSYYISICDKKIVSDLKSVWNIHPRKGRGELGLNKIPTIKNKDHICAFIIGCLDGDGWITKTGDNKLNIGFSGSLDLIKWIAKHTNYTNSIYGSKICNHYYKIEFYNNKAIDLAEKLLNINVPFRIPRKWNIAKSYLGK